MRWRGVIAPVFAWLLALVAAAAGPLGCTSANEQALAKMSAQQRSFLDDKIGRAP